MTEEHKQKIKIGVARAKAERAEGLRPPRKPRGTSRGVKKTPIIYITGEEKDALDFFPAIRECFRALHNYNIIPSILDEITHTPYWNNPEHVIGILHKYAEIVNKYTEMGVSGVKEKKVKRTRKPLTPEHIHAMNVGRQKAREAKQRSKACANSSAS